MTKFKKITKLETTIYIKNDNCWNGKKIFEVKLKILIGIFSVGRTGSLFFQEWLIN